LPISSLQEIFIADHSQPFHGVEAVLDAPAESGCPLAVCTNKLEWLSPRLLDALNLTKRFRATCGADIFGVSKPDPKILRGTIDRAGGDRDCTIMVGDSMTDIATARAGRIPVIAVDFGYSDVPVETLKPNRAVSSFRAAAGSDLPDVIYRSMWAGERLLKSANSPYGRHT
jgi:phosphoglycolate phosphatase